MKASEFYKKKIQPYAIDDNIEYSDLGLFGKFLVWLDARKYQDPASGSIGMKIDWSLAPKTDNQCWYIQSLCEDVPNGFYEQVGVKMFIRADINGNPKDNGYLFRSDDYNKSLIHCFKCNACCYISHKQY